MRCLLFTALALAVADPAMAARTMIGFQEIEDFDTSPIGTGSFDFGDPSPDDGILSGGAVAAGDLVFPARSGTQVYTGTEIRFDIADAINFSWPAIGAYVTGTAPVRLDTFGYDYIGGAEYFIASAIYDPASGANYYLSIGNGAPTFLTRAVFSSDAAFAIDDFTLGLPDVLPGIPEPAGWTLLIAGFGLTGAMLRQRRTAAVERVRG